jgi:predicted transcriptional regulator
MDFPKLSKMELQIMEALWTRGACAIREIHEAFPAKKRPGFTTIQTMVYRLESKNALRLAKRIGRANIFEAVLTRAEVRGRLIDDLLSLFGGKPVVAHLVKAGHLTVEDVKQAQEELRRLSKKEGSK